jgi:hypothetical protein
MTACKLSPALGGLEKAASLWTMKDYAARILTRDSIPGQVVRLAIRKS